MVQNSAISSLSLVEKKEARAAGVNAFMAEAFGTSEQRLRIMSVCNILHLTLDGPVGFMKVQVDWTTPEHRWHMRNLEFNGKNPINLPDEHLALLGRMACERPTDVLNYTIDSYGLPLRRPEPSAVLLETTPIIITPVAEKLAA